MRLEHNQICTCNSEVEAGKIYLYTEGNLECKVKVVQASQQIEGIRLSLMVVAKPQTSPIDLGEEFEVLAYWSHYDTGRWWHLHDNDLVFFHEDHSKKASLLFLETNLKNNATL